MKLRKGILLIFIFSYSVLKSQELDVILFNGFHQHKEELIHPLVYRGYKIGLGLAYSKKLKNENVFFSNANVSGIIKGLNRLQNDMSQVNVNIETGYLFKTNLNYWKTGVSLQAMYNYNLYSLNYEYPFWFTQYSLNWSNKLEFIISDDYCISSSISIPLFGFFSRTEDQVLYNFKRNYTKAYFHKDLTFDSLNNFQSFFGNITIYRDLSAKTTIGLGYYFHYFNYNLPKPVMAFTNSLSFNLKLRW